MRGACLEAAENSMRLAKRTGSGLVQEEVDLTGDLM